MTSPSCPPAGPGARGFTLIEVMITCAIIAILAAIAYPSYAEHVRKGRRADAQRALEEAGQFLRRRYSSMDSYAGATLPAEIQQSPREGPAAYNILFVEDKALVAQSTAAFSQHSFSLRAVRSGSMAGDRCGDLELAHTGARSIANGGAGATLTSCFPGG